MILITILIAVFVFGFYQYKQYQAGKFGEFSLQTNKLYQLLYVLPAAQLVVALFIAWLGYTWCYGSVLRLTFFVIIPLAYLVVNIFLLNKKKMPIRFCVIYTVVMSFVLSAEFCKKMIGFGNIMDILLYFDFDFDSDWFVVTILCSVVFSVLLILQFYYVRWITIFYGLHSPFEGWNLVNNVKTFHNYEQPTSSSETSSTIDIKKKSDMLHDLKQLLDDGILTKEEFDTEKNKILNS